MSIGLFIEKVLFDDDNLYIAVLIGAILFPIIGFIPIIKCAFIESNLSECSVDPYLGTNHHMDDFLFFGYCKTHILFEFYS